MRRFILSCILLLSLATSRSQGAAVVESDICVYGAMSGGIIAAVQAARMGKSVTLISINNHVGGMTSGGLGVTDRGNVASIGGLAREFYTRVGQKYGSSTQVYFFEPHVAEQVFRDMLGEAGVPVYTNQRLASVTMSNSQIASLTMEDGTIFRAKMFIDTTYEGDLIAKAGVNFTVGREAVATYNESLAGIRSPGGSYSYDPYVVPGNPASGLLPFVTGVSSGVVGQGDTRVQTYNFRLCLTQNPTNQIPIAAPANYAESQYELVARYVEARVAADGAVQLNQLIDVQTIIPNGKTDINANGELSTDYLGASDAWPTNTYAGREVIRQAHEDYTRGLLHFFATSPRVPLNVRTQMQSWQLCKDEFKDTGGWPHQIYVREGRRMISDYVMTQANCESSRVAPEPVALASYNIDSHPVRRVASGNFCRTEGGLGGTPPFPYPISYRSIIPATGQCQNVFCTFALSASHVAFASCRMEPVFMMTSQSAATAAALCIDDQVGAQALNYARLNAQLRADGQILTWTSASVSTNGIILDQGGPGTTSTAGWTQGANAGGWNGDYWHDNAAGKGSRWVKYTPTLPTNGTYEVYVWWVEASNRATNTPIDVIHPAGTNRILVNQKLSSGGWYKILTTNFLAGTNGSVIVRNDNTAIGTYCIADAVRFFPIGNIAVTTAPPVTVDMVASDPVAGEYGPNTGRVSIVRSGDTNSVVTVNYTVGGAATPGVDYQTLPGSVTLGAGALVTNIFIMPLADLAAEGQETVTLALQPSANYVLTSLSNATVTIQDRPADAWKRAYFSDAELTNSAVSGDLADPDQDGLSNLMEYVTGSSPRDPNSASRSAAYIQNDQLHFTYTRAKSATDVSVEIEQSGDLTQWQSADVLPGSQTVQDQGNVQIFDLSFADPVSSNAAFFIRLSVSHNGP